MSFCDTPLPTASSASIRTCTKNSRKILVILRDKKLAHFDPATITHAEIHNASGAILATSKNESDWALDASVQKDEGPNDKAKGSQQPKPLSLDKLFTPLQQATAEEIFDKPTPAILAKLAKPEFEAIFTNKSGKTLKVEISKESGGFVLRPNERIPKNLRTETRNSEGLEPEAFGLNALTACAAWHPEQRRAPSRIRQIRPQRARVPARLH